MECIPRNGTHCKTKEEVETNQLGILIETPTNLDPPHDSGSRSARVRKLYMNVMRRRQRRSSEAVRLSKRKQRHIYEKWQQNQIKIWTGMNEQALIEENNLKNSPQRVDKRQ